MIGKHKTSFAFNRQCELNTRNLAYNPNEPKLARAGGEAYIRMWLFLPTFMDWDIVKWRLWGSFECINNRFYSPSYGSFGWCYIALGDSTITGKYMWQLVILYNMAEAMQQLAVHPLDFVIFIELKWIKRLATLKSQVAVRGSWRRTRRELRYVKVLNKNFMLIIK